MAKPKSGDRAQGAASGAMSGAAMGTSILPGWGTAIGAVGGGLIGALSAKGKEDDGFGNYTPTPMDTRASDALFQDANGGDIRHLGQALGRGDSLASVLNQDSVGLHDINRLAQSPVYGSMLAQRQVLENPLLKGLYGGDDSALSRALAEEKQLQSRGYSLQPEDHEAYGQASDNIARMFGQQENSLKNTLARQGLGSAASGMAQRQFSGLTGNKYEQLGQMQRSIANDRMNKNMERLQQTRSFATSMGAQAQAAEKQQFGQNITGIQDRRQGLQSAADMHLNQWKAQNGMGMDIQSQANKIAEARAANPDQSLMGSLQRAGMNAISAYAGNSITDFLGGLGGGGKLSPGATEALSDGQGPTTGNAAKMNPYASPTNYSKKYGMG